MDRSRIDLHTHTTCSDGALTPRALVRKAHAAGLRAVAVTDHDTVAGVAAAQAAGAALGIDVVPGVELSVTVEGAEYHLLGYGMDLADGRFQDYLERFRRQRAERAEQMVDHLRALGVALSFDDVLAQASGDALGRPHVASALVAAGHVATPQEAFERYLGNRGPAFVPKPSFPAEAALDLVHAAGGVAVLAHPGHWTSDAVLMHLIRNGLDGIETVHPSHDDSLTRYYRRIARDFVLLETGGSDYHGTRPTDEAAFGRYTVPYRRLERLYRHQARRLADA